MFPLDREVSLPSQAFVCAWIGGVTDFRSRRVPNWLTGPAALVGLDSAILCWADGGTRQPQAWRDCLAGGLFLLLFLAGGMGGGDVKLIAAVCCLAGLSQTFTILIATALVGGVFAIVMALASRQMRQTISNVRSLIAHHRHEGLNSASRPQRQKCGPAALAVRHCHRSGTAFSLCRMMTG